MTIHSKLSSSWICPHAQEVREQCQICKHIPPGTLFRTAWLAPKDWSLLVVGTGGGAALRSGRMDIRNAATLRNTAITDHTRNSRHRRAVACATAALAAIGLTAGCASAPSHADTVVPNSTVLKVIDGDTIDVRSDERGRLRIRILGINTPETKFKVECGGPEASTYGHKLLDDQRVAIVADPTQDNTDRYGRTLAYVFLTSGDNYSVLAARSGHARAYVYGHRPSQWADRIAAAERQAQADGIGIWGDQCRAAENIAQGKAR